MLKAVKQVEHPITRTIIAFQMQFGFTKSEAIRINTHHAITNEGLMIERQLAANGKDRLVPILTQAQRTALHDRQSLLGEKGGLTDFADEAVLVALYKADCLIQGLEPAAPYRSHYARTRYRQLANYHDEAAALQQLQVELGVGKTARLRELMA